MKHRPWNINVSDGWGHTIHKKITDISFGQGHMILQTFQGYLYIMSKSVWKVRLTFSVATAVKAIVYNNVKGDNNNG